MGFFVAKLLKTITNYGLALKVLHVTRDMGSPVLLLQTEWVDKILVLYNAIMRCQMCLHDLWIEPNPKMFLRA